jgi:hypothetical protein
VAEKLPIHKVDKYVAFYTDQDGLDTVVFVHGLRGHYHTTWGKFPALLISDPDLPCLDVLLWGYKTGAIRPAVHDVGTEGKHLLSVLSNRIDRDNSMHLVGHSMGGLIILKGLVDEMIGRRAQGHPTCAVSFISLFASPVSGSTAGAMVKNTLGKLWFIRCIVNKQILSLARGEGCDTLLTEVYNRIYSPNQEDSSARAIPIRMIMATNDAAVTSTDRDSAKARYCNVRPKQFNYDHSSIKEPDSHVDDRYRALTNDLQDGFAMRFQTLCKTILGDDQVAIDDALVEFAKRYKDMLQRRYYDSSRNAEVDSGNYRNYVDLVVRDGARYGRPPFDTANRAIIALRARQ